jgi:hypothetical protein
MLFILIAFSAGGHHGLASSYWNVTGRPKSQIQERIDFLTLVQKNADAGSRSNLRVYSFHSLKLRYSLPGTNAHPAPEERFICCTAFPSRAGCFRSELCIRSRWESSSHSLLTCLFVPPADSSCKTDVCVQTFPLVSGAIATGASRGVGKYKNLGFPKGYAARLNTAGR